MKVGFKPKQPSVDCFLGKVVGKGKDIDTSDWFKERIPTGTSSPPRFQSFVDFGKALHSQNPISDDASAPPNIDLVFLVKFWSTTLCWCLLLSQLALIKL
jgi:hypothetical protein